MYCRQGCRLRSVVGLKDTQKVTLAPREFGQGAPPCLWWPLARPQQPYPRSRTRSRAPQHAPSHRPALMRARAPAHMPARAPDSFLPCCMRPPPCARRVPTSRTPRASHAPRACVMVAWAALHRLTPRPAHAAHRFLRDRRENHLRARWVFTLHHAEELCSGKQRVHRLFELYGVMLQRRITWRHCWQNETPMLG